MQCATCGSKKGIYSEDNQWTCNKCGDEFEVPEPRSLRVIAREIMATWPRPYFGAVPYIQAMSALDKMTDAYGADDADGIVRYFLVNAKTWRGDDARRIKAELNGML